MSNKIDSISHQVPVTRQDNRSGPEASSPSASGAAGASETNSADTVELTGMAQRLKALEASVAELPEVDEARVAALREQIESGEYTVDSRSVADKMLGLDKQMPESDQ